MEVKQVRSMHEAIAVVLALFMATVYVSPAAAALGGVPGAEAAEVVDDAAGQLTDERIEEVLADFGVSDVPVPRHLVHGPRDVTFDPPSLPANQTQDGEVVTLNVTLEDIIHPSSSPDGPNGTLDVLYDRITINKDNPLGVDDRADVLAVRVGGVNSTDRTDLFYENPDGCEPEPAVLLGEWETLALSGIVPGIIPQRHVVCMDGDSLHITVGNLARYAQDPNGTVEVDLFITPPTEAAIYEMNVALFYSASALDHALDLGSQAQDAAADVRDAAEGAGAQVCAEVPEELPDEVPDDAGNPLDVAEACPLPLDASQSATFEVLPGPLDDFQLLCAPDPVIVNQTVTCTASDGVDAFENEQPLVDVEWNVTDSEGGAVALDGEDADPDNGIFTATFTAPTDVSLGAITVTVTGEDANGDTADNTTSVALEADEIDDLQLVCSPNPVLVTNPFTCTANDGVDQFGNEQPLQDVSWNATDRVGDEVPVDEEDDDPANGTFTATFTAPTDVSLGNVTVTATGEDADGNEAENSTEVELVAPAANLTFVDPVATIEAGSCVGFTVQRQDENGNPVSEEEDLLVNLTTTSDAGTFHADPACEAATSNVTIEQGNSSAEFHYRDTAAGTPTLTANATGLDNGTHLLTVEPGPLTLLEVECDPATVPAGGDTDCTATPRDEFGNVRDDEPTWSAVNETGDPAGGFSVFQGQETTYFPPTETGVYTVNATVETDEGEVSNTTDVTVQPNDIDEIRFLDHPAGETFEVSADDPVFGDVCVEVVDAFGNTISDLEIFWTLLDPDEDNEGTGSLSPASSTTDAEGIACVELTTSTVADDDFRIRAADDDTDPTETRTSGTWVVVPGALVEIRILDAAGGAGDAIPDQTLTAGDELEVFAAGFDQHGNFRQDEQVEWSLTNPIGELSPTTGTSTNFTATTVGDGRIVATHEDGPSNETGILTVIAGPADHVQIEDDSDGSGEVIGDHEMTTDETLTVYAICRDSFGNFVSNPRVTWNVTGTLEDDDVPETAKKVFSFSPDTAGTSGNITADAGDKCNLDTDETGTITVNPGVLDHFVIEVNDPQPVEAGTAFEFNVTAEDADGNTKTDYRGTVSFSTTDEHEDVVLPDDYTFTADDAGVHTFTATLITSDPENGRTQDLTVRDELCCVEETATIQVDPSDCIADFVMDPRKGETVQIDLGDTATVEATALDEFDNPCLAGETVHWTLLRGSNNAAQDTGSLSDTQTETDENGVARVNLTVSTDVGDIFRVRASSDPDPNGHPNGTSGKFEVIRIVSDGESIQDAVDAAAEGETILVESGTYNETVTVNKTLTLNGTRSGEDARDRSGDESFVGNETGAFVLEADNVTLDGFTVRGVTDCLQGGISTSPSASGYRILNNIVEDNDLGIKLRSDGTTETIVRHNLVRNNNATVGDGTCDDVAKGIATGFDPGDVLRNATVEENRIVGHTEGADSYSVNLVANQGGHDNVTLRNNNLSGDSSVILADLENGTIEDNTIVMDDGDSSTAVFLAGNVTETTFDGNTINGTDRGIWFAPDFFGVPDANANVTITNNTIEGNDNAGLEIADDRAEGDVVVEDNVFDDNDVHVRDNEGILNLDAVLDANTFPEGTIVDDGAGEIRTE